MIIGAQLCLMLILACANSDAIFDYFERACWKKKKNDDEEETVDLETIYIQTEPKKKKKAKNN